MKIEIIYDLRHSFQLLNTFGELLSAIYSINEIEMEKNKGIIS